MRKSRRTLHEDWTLSLARASDSAPADLTGRAIAATVPGCVHTDLLAAGVIDDPHLGTNEDDQHWIGRSDWRYATTFEWRDAGFDAVQLACDGLDTVAQITINGRIVGRTQNQHRSYRFDVRDHLADGTNRLEIHFSSPYTLTERVHAEVGDLPKPYPTPYCYIRKMACNFGWDWGPQLVTAGIWRPIALEEWSIGRLASVVPHVRVDGSSGTVTVRAEVESSDGAPPARMRAGVRGVVAEAPVVDGAAEVTLAVDDVERWWPVGLGQPTRYALDVDLLAGEDRIDAWSRRIGFRTVEVDEPPDDVGRRWALRINGRRVRVRGFNWIPDHTFPTEVDARRYADRIDQAVHADANLLRVWGGGIYEDEAFYDACDERGMLVWQDFLFACAAYPETDDYVADVDAEAREAVSRLSPHPSLVLWNGNNECVWGWHDWGWQDVLQGRPWGARYYFDLLPSIVAELDPTRPYLPGSPWGGDPRHAPNDHNVGVSHLWDVWNDLDYVAYRGHAPSFVAEMGWCGPPTWATMRRAVPQGQLGPDSPALHHHLRAENGMAKLERGLAAHFPDLADSDDWYHALAVNQARAMSTGVEHLRSVDRCAGAVVWQLNDCWPVISWAAVDGDGRRKPVWYALRRAFAPRLVTVQPSSDGLAVVLVNDSATVWHADLVLRRVRFDGVVLSGDRRRLDCDVDGLVRLALPDELAVPSDPRSEVLVVDGGDHRATWWWAEDRDLAYPPASADVHVQDGGDALLVTVTARSLLRDVGVFPDRVLLDGQPVSPDHPVGVDEQLITLLPGEQHTFRVTGVGPTAADALRRPPAFRAINSIRDLVDMDGGLAGTT